MRRKTALENRLTPILLCFLFIILGHRTANAAEQRVLTLEELIQTALESSPELKMAEAVREQVLVQYRKVIQNAFRDMEDALADQRHAKEQFEAQAR